MRLLMFGVAFWMYVSLVGYRAVASASDARSMEEAVTLTTRAVRGTEGAPVQSVFFLPCKDWFVAVTRPGGINVWKGKVPNLHPFVHRAFAQSIRKVSPSPRGDYFLVLLTNGQVRYWKQGSGTFFIPDLKTQLQYTAVLALNRIFLLGREDGVLEVRDARTRQLIKTIGLGDWLWLTAMSYTSQRKLLAVGAHTGNIHILYLDTEHLDSILYLGKISAHLGWVHALVWTSDGAMLFSGGSDGDVYLWRVLADRVGTQVQARELLTFSFSEFSPARVRALALDPTGRILAVGGESHMVFLWNFERDLQRQKQRAQYQEVSRRGRRRRPRWKVQPMSLTVETLKTPLTTVHTLAFAPQGLWLAVAGDQARVFLYPLHRMTPTIFMHMSDTILQTYCSDLLTEWLSVSDALIHKCCVQVVRGVSPSPEACIREQLHDKHMRMHILATFLQDSLQAVWRAHAQLFAPRGEFEPRQEYEARRRRARQLACSTWRSFLENAYELAQKRLVHYCMLEPATIQQVERYNPDEQFFPAQIDGQLLRLYIPLEEARQFKARWHETQAYAVWGLNWEGDTIPIGYAFRIEDSARWFLAPTVPHMRNHPCMASGEVLENKLKTMQFWASRYPPYLHLDTVFVEETWSDDIIDEYEKVLLHVRVQNTGQGAARNVRVILSPEPLCIRAETLRLAYLAPGATHTFKIALKPQSLHGQECETRLSIGLRAKQFSEDHANRLTLRVRPYRQPDLKVVVSHIQEVSGNQNQIAEPNEYVRVYLNLVNEGSVVARGLRLALVVPPAYRNQLYLSAPQPKEIDLLGPASSVQISFGMRLKPGLDEALLLKVTDVSGKPMHLRINLREALPFQPINLAQVPATQATCPNCYALVIVNQDYMGGYDLKFAERDGELVAKYFQAVLGIPPNYVFLYKNLTAMQFRKALQEFAQRAQNASYIFFYYRGHGLPHPGTKQPSFVPVDLSPIEPSMGLISIAEIVDRLSKAKAERILLFVDACYTGAETPQEKAVSWAGPPIQQGQTAILPKKNAILFSAVTRDQRAYAPDALGHGLFTYAWLATLHEQSRQIEALTLGTMYDSLYQTMETLGKVLLRGQEQTPTVVTHYSDPVWRAFPLIPGASPGRKRKE